MRYREREGDVSILFSLYLSLLPFFCMKTHMVSLFCLCHKLANKGIFSTEVGKNYFLNFTDWAHKDSTARLIVICLTLTVFILNGSLKIVLQVMFTGFSIPGYSRSFIQTG